MGRRFVLRAHEVKEDEAGVAADEQDEVAEAAVARRKGATDICVYALEESGSAV